MATRCLDYSIRNKLDTQYLRDMTRLDDRVRQVKRLKADKPVTSKYCKKEKIEYADKEEYPLDLVNNYVEEMRSI